MVFGCGQWHAVRVGSVVSSYNKYSSVCTSSRVAKTIASSVADAGVVCPLELPDLTACRSLVAVDVPVDGVRERSSQRGHRRAGRLPGAGAGPAHLLHITGD